MLFVTRHRVPESETAAFRQAAGEAVEALRTRPGFLTAHVGRALDERDLWVLTSTWESLGAGRRALSSGDTRIALMGVMRTALDESSAFELVDPEPMAPAPHR